jgi:GT2 family glycosyltransferase
MTDRAGVIVIGRNEGARLEACLAAMPGDVAGLVYVDSGSTDGSVAAARAAGAHVVELDPAIPFTAARARNAGVAALTAAGIAPDYLQFIDGDCTLGPGWLATAIAFLDATPAAAVVCGRRRERHPEASVYNRLCDREWTTPIGQARACGGDALMRRVAFEAAGGFRDDLIAGEEPELCVRLRAAGWQVWRIDAEMTLHDAAMTRFGQWWKRVRRGGFAAAEGVALHGQGPDRHGVIQTRRALLWGLVFPVAVLLGAFITPWALALLLAYPAQIVRLALRKGACRTDWEEAAFLTLGKFPEVLGILDHAGRRVLGGARKELIEYK